MSPLVIATNTAPTPELGLEEERLIEWDALAAG
jgi:hypothetical protein